MSKTELTIIEAPSALQAASLPFTKAFIANCDGLDVTHPDAARVAEKTFVKNVGPILRESALCVALVTAEETMNDPQVPQRARKAAQLFYSRNSKR